MNITNQTAEIKQLESERQRLLSLTMKCFTSEDQREVDVKIIAVEKKMKALGFDIHAID